MAAVGLLFAPLAPLVVVAAAVVFWISSFVYKYQLMFVFVSKVESGGVSDLPPLFLLMWSSFCWWLFCLCSDFGMWSLIGYLWPLCSCKRSWCWVCTCLGIANEGSFIDVIIFFSHWSTGRLGILQMGLNYPTNFYAPRFQNLHQPRLPT